MNRLLLSVCLFFLAFSCSKNNEEEVFTHYHEDGRAKPIVAIATVIDSTSYNLPWSLSDEFTSLLRLQLSRNKAFFIPPQENVDHYLSYSNNPFDPDISWMNKEFGSYEFLIFIELLDHKNVSIDNLNNIYLSPNCQNISTNLKTKTRIRVVDIRGKNPQVILQEILDDSYFISKNQLRTNYDIAVWGTEIYQATPLSFAHNQLTKKIIERIEDYIMLAKSR